jgi:uncharacterized RDD family membrane protein YckC
MTYVYGGFWRRFFAFMIDEMLLTAIGWFFFLIGGTALGLGIQTREMSFDKEIFWGLNLKYVLLYQFLTVLLSMAYFTYLHGMMGQTLGKKILGLKVMQETGESMRPGLAFLRWVGYLINAVCMNLGFIWVAFDGRKQGWHDKIAGTVVIRTEYEARPDLWAKKPLTKEGISITKQAFETGPSNGSVAQQVEHRTENPGVGGSTPP